MLFQFFVVWRCSKKRW